MFYAAFTIEGQTHSNLYFDFEQFHRDTFSPETDIHAIVEFKTHGKSYAERKESARNTAINFQAAEIPGLSYSEIAEISAYFEKTGKRYGLLEEFRENAIC